LHNKFEYARDKLFYKPYAIDKAYGLLLFKT
jgi:hypothetical protein